MVMSHSLRLCKFLVCSSSSCTPGSVLSWLASLPTSFCGSLNYTVQFGCVIFRVLQCLWCHVLESLARISLTSGMFLTFTVLFLDVGWMCLLPALSASCALPGSLCWYTAGFNLVTWVIRDVSQIPGHRLHGEVQDAVLKNCSKRDER